MGKRLINILLLCVCLLYSNTAYAQKFIYDIDLLSYFDNREYDHRYAEPQTLFATRLSPTVGVMVPDRQGGHHKVMAGLHYTQPMGGNWRDIHLTPTVYYRYDYKGFIVGLGAIPYTERITPLPDYLLYDSIAYMHPNMQGAWLAYHSSQGYAEFMCDWRSMKSPERRELFRLVLNGEWQWQWLHLGGIAQMNHKANFAAPTPREGVCDDIYVNPYVAFDVSGYTPFDSLALRAGYIVGIQRERETGMNYLPQGGIVELYMNWRFLGMKNILYAGDNLMPLYETYGTALNQGSPFYRARLYNRTDLFIYLISKSFVNCYFSWNMHYASGCKGLQHQQQLIVRFNLDGLHKERKLRGIFDK